MKNKKSVTTLFKQFCCFNTAQQTGISNIKGKYPVLSKTICCEDCSCDFAAKQTIFPSKAGKAKTGALRKPCTSPFKTMVRVRPPHFITSTNNEFATSTSPGPAHKSWTVLTGGHYGRKRDANNISFEDIGSTSTCKTSSCSYRWPLASLRSRLLGDRRAGFRSWPFSNLCSRLLGDRRAAFCSWPLCNLRSRLLGDTAAAFCSWPFSNLLSRLLDTPVGFDIFGCRRFVSFLSSSSATASWRRWGRSSIRNIRTSHNSWTWGRSRRSTCTCLSTSILHQRPLSNPQKHLVSLTNSGIGIKQHSNLRRGEVWWLWPETLFWSLGSRSVIAIVHYRIHNSWRRLSRFLKRWCQHGAWGAWGGWGGWAWRRHVHGWQQLFSVHGTRGHD